MSQSCHWQTASPIANFLTAQEQACGEFELASALEVQQAWSQKENANRSFFGHILKTASCTKGTACLRQIAYHSGGISNQAQLYNDIIGGRECIYRFR
jgi:hypothetical protein